MKVFDFSPAKEQLSTESLSRRDSLQKREHALKQQIAQSEEIGGAGNPWLAEMYCELGSTIFERGLIAGKDSGVLAESLQNFSKALRIAEANGDLNNRIRVLKEIGVCEAALGNEERSHEVSLESSRLRFLQVRLELIPSADRLRYDQPAMPTEMRYADRLRFEDEVALLAKGVLSIQEDMLTPKRIGRAVVGELLAAASRQQWMDDLFVLELSQRLEGQFSCGEAKAEQLAYGALPIASRYMELGLKASSLDRLSKL